MSISNEQLLAFVKKNPIGVGCGVLSLALAAAIYFRADLVPQARVALEQKGTLSDRLAANLKYGKDLPEQLQQFTDDNKVIDSRLIKASDILGNQQYFYNLETVTGTKIGQTPTTTAAQVTAQMKAAKSNFAPIGFNINVTGTYPQLLDFLGRLENGLHFSRVTNSRCSKASGGNADLLTLTLSLELLGLP